MWKCFIVVMGDVLRADAAYPCSIALHSRRCLWFLIIFMFVVIQSFGELSLVSHSVYVAGIIALGNTTKSTIPLSQDLVRYSHLRHWRSTEVHKRGMYTPTILLANVRYMLSPVRLSSVVCRLSVCRLSVVCNTRAPYSADCNFRQYFYGVRYLGHPLTSTENFT